jgi:hypothetical protein
VKRVGRVLLVVGIGLAGCSYSFRAGAGFPPEVKTVAVIPFDNETTRFELTQEVFDALVLELPRALGLNPAGEDVADAVVRGSITRYSLDAPLYRSGQPGQAAEVLQRQVTLVVAVEIVNLQTNEILWENSNVSAQGQYLEASEQEELGREEAIEQLVQLIVDGAQSNW